MFLQRSLEHRQYLLISIWAVTLAVASKADCLRQPGFIGLDFTLFYGAIAWIRFAVTHCVGAGCGFALPHLYGSRKYSVEVANTFATTSVMSAPDRSYAAIDKQ